VDLMWEVREKSTSGDMHGHVSNRDVVGPYQQQEIINRSCDSGATRFCSDVLRSDRNSN
jgi:hypothetical protein